ncbi:hypothetical protein F0L74_10115 [Chitinophaga agrisoli]|uniref:PXPV repeat-containing protein n=1 Tax=Chitinophaga agrisoli TaxID=2607653 RepID=A0A5B2VSV2_9BACT|nr:hypothetical protein [Chitinophaga agrisoli]KAA2242873.1 hypothetical protein F0L74_10115 [Chitinophaga agrisoli]
MKRVFFMMLLLMGIVFSSQAQRGHYDRGYGHGRGHGNGHWKHERYYYNDCRPGRVVVYRQPVYVAPRPVYVAPAPVYYAPPPPPPVVYYPSRPRVVVNAGITIVH